MNHGRAILVPGFTPKTEDDWLVHAIYQLIIQDSLHTNSGDVELRMEVQKQLSPLINQLDKRLKKYLKPYTSAKIRTVM